MITPVFVVASLAEAWIEISRITQTADAITVASLAEAWIEIQTLSRYGLTAKVASLAEAWIEILSQHPNVIRNGVASLAEAWIEIESRRQHQNHSQSPPSRRRGLKCPVLEVTTKMLFGRLPRGGVD